MKYLIDSNVIINFHHYAPKEYHPKFWEELASLISKGDIVLLDTIANECKDPGLEDWLKRLKDSIRFVDKEISQLGTEINEKFDVITKRPKGHLKSVADTHLIAYGQKFGLAILTLEKGRSSESKKSKIPDVCKELGIHCENSVKTALDELNFVGCG